VQQLSQILVEPAIRILKYIKGASSLGLFFSSNTSAHLKAFVIVIGATLVIQDN